MCAKYCAKHIDYSWPFNNTGLNSEGPLTRGFVFSIYSWECTWVLDRTGWAPIIPVIFKGQLYIVMS